MSKFPGEPSSPQTARMNRLRLAAGQNTRTMEEVAKNAADVRANMMRLRELRLAKEAEMARTEPAPERIEPK